MQEVQKLFVGSYQNLTLFFWRGGGGSGQFEKLFTFTVGVWYQYSIYKKNKISQMVQNNNVYTSIGGGGGHK